MVDFLGIGAQRTGTSWMYACLYEHPDICIPIKEIHFFSRPRYEKGFLWYESHFARCREGAMCGEFSTSYLYSKEAPERIHAQYPEVKIIVILRNPIHRAFSQYGNAVKGGEVPETMSFKEYCNVEKSALEQGKYAEQLIRYTNRFSPSHMLVLIHEDNKKDPEACIKKVYEFLGVRSDFVPSMLHDVVNVTRVPKNITLERYMHFFSEWLRKKGFDKLVHYVRKSGLPELVRLCNTKKSAQSTEQEYDYSELASFFHDDVRELSILIGRDMNKEWNI